MISINDAQFIAAIIGSQLSSDADRDNPSGTSYFGFVGRDGSWRIMKQIIAGGVSSYRYVSGDGKTGGTYSSNWATHASRSDYAYPA